MKNKLDTLFDKKESNILSIFYTAGFPKLNDTVKILHELEESGVDLVEIGIPYSDPLADGPVIQESSKIAINNGMTLNILFEQLHKRKAKIPIILMGYLNSIMQFGIQRFYENCANSSISGIIIPDLPLEEFEKEHKLLSQKFNVKVIFLITPRASIDRIKEVIKMSESFIYVVSSNTITGGNNSNSSELSTLFTQLNKLELKNKTLIGFGISNHQSFTNACTLANGAIIGSAFIHAIANNVPTYKFINSIKNTIHVVT